MSIQKLCFAMLVKNTKKIGYQDRNKILTKINLYGGVLIYHEDLHNLLTLL